MIDNLVDIVCEDDYLRKKILFTSNVVPKGTGQGGYTKKSIWRCRVER